MVSHSKGRHSETKRYLGLTEVGKFVLEQKVKAKEPLVLISCTNLFWLRYAAIM